MKLRNTLFFAVILLFITNATFAQAPPLGTAANFVLFSTNGGVSNTGVSQVTGNVGTNSGTSTGFGNINGSIHDNDATSALAAADVMVAYNQLNSTVPTFFPASLLGNGQVLSPGVYSIATAATLNLNLTLDAQGDSNAVFIFKIQGSFATGINANVQLINGASPCNVFWKVEGLVNLAPGTNMRGTVIANNGPIIISAATLEGRALAINGSIAINSATTYRPTSCGCPMLNGPLAPVEGTTSCYALFSSNGTVTNTGVTFANGDVGSNNGTATGYNPLTITGTIHPVPDGSTAASAAALTTMYNYLNVLTPDIQLMFPAQFGNGLTLTPHTYLLNGNTTLTNTLFLDALGNTNAVFVIKVNGSFTTSVNSQVVLMNGAQAQHVYWKIEDDVTINASSVFNGNIISQGNIALNAGVTLNGRALTRSGNVTTNTVNVVLPSCCPPFPAPVITLQPANQTACLGGSVSFVVGATGTGLTYQWRRGNINIAGATNDTLTINPVTLADAGNNYNVIVSASCTGKDTSINVSLIIDSTVITTQPVSQTVCEGDSVSFTVSASGTGLIYQWYHDAVAVPGATNNTLTINPAVTGHAGMYYVIVSSSGACSGADTSVNVSLNIGADSAIIVQPISQTICQGDSASLVVVSVGAGLTYQWYLNSVAISGATNDTLTIAAASAANAGTYNVIVSGTCISSDTSLNAILTVNPVSTTITTQPVGQHICLGDSTGFSVAASGIGLTYQWMHGNNAIPGATNDTLIIDTTVASHSGPYSVIVSGLGICPGSVTSNTVLLLISLPPTITTEPTNQFICLGDSTGFIVAATGTGLTYQWYHDTVAVPGATNDTLIYNPAPAAQSGFYYVIVSGSGGCESDTSAIAQLIISAPAGSITPPVSQTACAGDSVSFVFNSTGNGLIYQWSKNNINLTDSANISGATNDTLTINPVTLSDTSSNYTLYVYAMGCAESDTSFTISLQLGSDSIITTQPVSQTVCEGDSVSFVVGTTGSGLTYQWMRGNVPILLATNDTLTFNPVTWAHAANNYSVIVTGACGADTSNLFSLNVSSDSVIISQPVSQTVCTGDSVSFVVGTIGTGLTFQWYGDNTVIAGATNDTLTISSASISNSGTYYVIVSGTCAGNDTSANVTLGINASPIFFTQPINQTVCEGDSALFSVIALGNVLNYQWTVNGMNIPGETNDTLIINPTLITDTGTYNVIVTDVCGTSDTSANASLTINSDSVIIAQPISQTVCTGDSVSFVVGTIGTGLTFQWYGDSTAIAGATNDTLTISSASISNSGTYFVIVSGGCGGADTSASVTLGINASPIFFTQPVSQTVCEGDSAFFSVIAVGNGLTYQWTVDGTTIAGETNDTIIINPALLTDSGIYNVIVTDVCGVIDTSANVSLTINSDSTITTQPVSQTVCVGDSVSFVVGTTGSGLSYQWMNGNTPIAGAMNDTLTFASAQVTDSSSTYYVIVNGGCSGADTSATVSLIVNTPATITAQPVSQTICEGDSVSLTVTAMGTGVTYQWIHNNTTIAGATNDTLTFTSAAATDAGTYYVIVSGGTCGSDTSTIINLGVNSAPTITTQPVSITACEGDSVSFTVAATGSGLTYQWIHGITPVGGATNDTLTINPVTLADSSGTYYVVAIGTCGNETSSSVTLTINSPTVIISQPISQTVCEGDSVSFVITATGTNTTYQWMNGNTPIAGATNDTLTFNPVVMANASGNYYVLVSGACSANDSSSVVSLTVNPATTITAQPVSQTVCEGDSVSFTVSATGNGVTYQWMNGNTPIAGATNDTLTFNPAGTANASTSYNVIVSGGCSASDTSVNVSLTVNTAPVVTTQPTSQTVCENGSVSFVTGATGTNVTYQWMNGNTAIAGATNSTFTINPVTTGDASTNYYVVVSGTCSPNDTSSVFTLTVNPAPEAIASGETDICLNSSISLNAQAVAGASYSWTGPNGFTANTQNIFIAFAALNSAGTYNLTVTANGCTSTVSSVIVSVSDCDSLVGVSVPEGFSPNSDMINDVFVIRGILDFPANTFSIYNRWGVKIYEAGPYQNTWDGTASKGIIVDDGVLPVGTYFYVLDLGNDSDPIKGTIFLNR